MESVTNLKSLGVPMMRPATTNADATDDDGSCTYADTGYDCDGNCLADTDGDGICDEFEVAGCSDDAACNYDAGATDDDGHALCRYWLRLRWQLPS